MKNLIVMAFVLAAWGNAIGALKFEKYAIEENIPAGTSTRDFIFKFKNEGNSKIVIKEIKTACGCTVSQNDKTAYEPNESGEIKGTFNVGDRSGVQYNEIYVHTDDIGQSKIKLLLKIQIQPVVTIKPSLVIWKKGEKNLEKTVFLQINDKSATNLVSVETDNKNISVVLTADEKNHQNFILKIKPQTTSENSRGLIKIKVRQNENEKTFFLHVLVK